MRRILLLATLMALALTAAAPVATAQQGPECPANQVNVLLENGEFICVPGGSAEQTPAEQEAIANDPRSNAETPLIENPRNCDEFYGSQASAQQFLENVTPQDEFNLDADNDGIACEGLLEGSQEDGEDQGQQAASAQDGAAQQQYQQPVEQDDQMQGLPDTGGPALLLPVAGVLVGSGIFGLFVARRRTS